MSNAYLKIYEMNEKEHDALVQVVKSPENQYRSESSQGIELYIRLLEFGKPKYSAGHMFVNCVELDVSENTPASLVSKVMSTFLKEAKK